MPGELTVANLADNVRDKVRSTIMNLIPDEQIDALVKKEWDTFFERPKQERWDNTEKFSPFQLMVRAETEKLIREKVKDEVEKEISRFNQSTWETQGRKAVGELVQAYAPFVLKGISESLVVDCMQQIQQQRGY